MKKIFVVLAIVSGLVQAQAAIRGGGKIIPIDPPPAVYLPPTSVPGNFTATTSFSTSVNFLPTLTWTDTTLNEDGFKVERKIGDATGTPFILIATIPANGTFYADIAANDIFQSNPANVNTSFTYRLTVYNAEGRLTSATYPRVVPSSLAVTTAPSNLAISTASSGPMNFLPLLTWKDNSNNEDGFSIERKVGNGPYMSVGFTERNVTTYFDLDANSVLQQDPMNFYRVFMYRVTAANRYGSKMSNEVGVSPASSTPMFSPVALKSTVKLMR